jgi:flagellar biosynthetic protein FlhB
MSEDRTQPPSKRRRQLAREQGQAAHSPELTAAVGWLIAVLLLGFWGDDLANSLVGLARGAVIESTALSIDPATLVANLRSAALDVIVPLAIVLLGFAAGATAAHQLQVQGLWAASLIAPDPARLWIVGRGGSLAGGAERIVWSITKAIVLVGVSLWMIRAEWAQIERLCDQDFPAVAGAAGHLLIRFAQVVGLVMLILGMVDYGLRYFRFEAMLRTTPEEEREDRRVMEGDRVLRSKRRRLAQAWRGDAPELPVGASLLVIGARGLTVVLAGGPPPRRVTVRSVAEGTTGLTLRRVSSAARLPQLKAPDLAQRLAHHAAAGSLTGTALPVELTTELAVIWPRM